MKVPTLFVVLLLLASAPAPGWESKTLRMSDSELAEIKRAGPAGSPACTMGYYYLIDDCALVSVVSGVEEKQTVGVCLDMVEATAWHTPCDTNACLTLDVIKIVLYDVLAPPADQTMNLKVYAAGESGQVEGDMLGNLDFSPAYGGESAFTSTLIDFTNEGTVPGLDLSGCAGRCVVLLTWENDTGHPGLVLDIVSACVDSCGANAACCAMGVPPYIYPRGTVHTYDYGHTAEPGEPGPICDPAEGGGTCPTYGYLEAVWNAYFCTTSTSVEATTWGSIKTLYR